MVLSEKERQLLERLAAEGKATRLLDEDLATAKDLEAVGLPFLVGTSAVARGRDPKGETPPRGARAETAKAAEATIQPPGIGGRLDPDRREEGIGRSAQGLD